MTKTEHCRNDQQACEIEFSDFFAAAEPAKPWLKAAATLALYGNQSRDEVVELIGPYQYPDLYACVVAMLTSPGVAPYRGTKAGPIPWLRLGTAGERRFQSGALGRHSLSSTARPPRGREVLGLDQARSMDRRIATGADNACG